MLTDFGKFTRKLRVDHDQLLKDMAYKLGVTMSYLSAVEHGKRKIPNEWGAKLREHYDLTETQVTELAKITILDQFTSRELAALNAALSVIHLNDSSDYINGLWDVLRALLGNDVLDAESFSVKEWTNLLGTFKE